TLQKALAVDLEQSPYLNVFPERKAQQTLQFMGRAPDERITSEIGREICQSNGIKAMLTGSIASLGNQYVVTLEAMNAANGDSLAREQSQSGSTEDVLNALHKATSALRGKLGESLASVDHRERAFERLVRAGERETLYVMSHYYADAGQLDKGITALEMYKQTSPRDSIPSNDLSSIYLQLGQFENAMQNARLSIDTDPSSVSGYENLAAAYMGLGRLDEAKATLNQAFQHNLNLPILHIQLATLAWDQGEEATMEKELQLAAAEFNGEYSVLGFRAGLAGARGQLKQARDFIHRANEAAIRLNLKESVPLMLAQQADLEALVGNRTRAVTWASE